MRRKDMGEQTNQSDEPVIGWRLKLGSTVFISSIVLPVIGVPLVTALNLSTKMTTTISGALLVGAEIIGITAVAVMGKSGYAYIKNKIFGFLKRFGPPRKVGRLRYTIGLVMFSIPLLFGWVTPYAARVAPGFMPDPIYCAISGDLLFLTSLFVLGGDFWDKIQSLFIHNAEVRYRTS
jgi:hypothetical protein